MNLTVEERAGVHFLAMQEARRLAKVYLQEPTWVQAVMLNEQNRHGYFALYANPVAEVPQDGRLGFHTFLGTKVFAAVTPPKPVPVPTEIDF